MLKVALAAAVGWAYGFLRTPRGAEMAERLERAVWPEWTQHRSTERCGGCKAWPRTPHKEGCPSITGIPADQCTGPHTCGGSQLAYCRESCTNCSGRKVRPCFNHGADRYDRAKR